MTADRATVPCGYEERLCAVTPAAPTAGRGTCLYRQAVPDELGRAASLCPPASARPGEGPQRCFVAVRTQPVERLLAAAFWKVVPETDGTLTAEIQWTALAVLADEVPAFLEALIAHVAEQEPGVVAVAGADWLPVGHPAAAVLQAVGFSPAGTRTVFRADAAVWRQTLGELAEPKVLVPPHGNHFDALRTLLCGASLRPSELAYGCHTAGSEAPSLFDPRCSGVILAADGKVVAACLANAAHGHLTLAALAGPPNTSALAGRMAGTVLRNGPANETRMSLPMRVPERRFMAPSFASHSLGPLGETVPASANSLAEGAKATVLAGPPDLCACLLHHCLQGRDHLPEPATLSFHLDDRDPPAALAGLLERLPHHTAGQLVRYARPLATAAGMLAERKGATA